MDDSYFETTPPYLGRAGKLLLLFSVLRIKHPGQWAAFLSFNPGIRSWLLRLLQNRYKDPLTVDRRTRKLANLITVCFLYSATSTNRKIPKDYLSLYLCEAYYGQLVPPSSPIVVSPSFGAHFRLSSYKADGWARRIYKNKHYIVFPILCGQILSNYLTPTRYKLNQRYFSGFIKSSFLDPIWTHFRLGVRFSSVAWWGILRSYIKHNGLLFLYVAVLNFKTRVWNSFFGEDSENGFSSDRLKEIMRKYVMYCLSRANTVTNFVYLPNLILMVLLSLTSPLLSQWRPLHKLYTRNQKQTVKMYLRVIGLTAGVSAMLLQRKGIELLSLFKPKAWISEPQNETPRLTKATQSRKNPRFLEPDFYNDVDMYLAQLIVLSKWRILKENHPWFTLLKVGTWSRMETGLMCFLVWKIMNLNDYINKHSILAEDPELDKLKSSPWVKAVDRIMN